MVLVMVPAHVALLNACGFSLFVTVFDYWWELLQMSVLRVLFIPPCSQARYGVNFLRRLRHSQGMFSGSMLSALAFPSLSSLMYRLLREQGILVELLWPLLANVW